jgi:phosphinothricin acetyltransferase
MDVRDALESDLPAILEITNEAIANTTAVWSLTPATLEQRRSWWRDRTAVGMPVLVAASAERVVGFASFAQFRPWEGYLHSVEHSIYVDAGVRGQGIGRALLSALIGRAEAAGKHVIIGGIEATNAVSIHLHASLGFTEVGRLPEVGHKFGRWLDLIFMQKRLGTG